jgi:hypothetical protein
MVLLSTVTQIRFALQYCPQIKRVNASREKIITGSASGLEEILSYSSANSGTKALSLNLLQKLLHEIIDIRLTSFQIQFKANVQQEICGMSLSITVLFLIVRQPWRTVSWLECGSGKSSVPKNLLRD